jgi:ATP synthase protein I
MSEGPPPDPLARLEQRLERARQEQAGGNVERGRAAAGPPRGALGTGMRVGIELVAGLVVGLVLGWGFDRLFGTRPWGLIVFFLLGAAAGMLNVYRLAKQIVLGPPSGGAGTRE